MKNKKTSINYEKMLLYENASLKKIIDVHKENLTIAHFNITLDKKVSLKKILSNPIELYAVKSVELPEINHQNFMPFLDSYLVDIDKRVDKFRSNNSISQADKIKVITLLISECSQMEMEYYPYNRVLVFYNFEWKYNGVPIPFSRIILKPTEYEKVREEILLRYELFQFIKMKLELLKMKLEAEKPVSNNVQWKRTKRPELIMTEIVQALEEKKYIEFGNENSKTEFVEELKKTFSLKDFKWSEMVSEINKRKRFKYKSLRELYR